MKLDYETFDMAALLHDVMKIHRHHHQDVEQRWFIAEPGEGYRSMINSSSAVIRKEAGRKLKMIVAMVRDIRVILIKRRPTTWHARYRLQPLDKRSPHRARGNSSPARWRAVQIITAMENRTRAGFTRRCIPNPLSCLIPKEVVNRARIIVKRMIGILLKSKAFGKRGMPCRVDGRENIFIQFTANGAQKSGVFNHGHLRFRVIVNDS